MSEKMGEEGCEGERETAQVSSSVDVVVNVQWSQIRDPWLLGGSAPHRPYNPGRGPKAWPGQAGLVGLALAPSGLGKRDAGDERKSNLTALDTTQYT